MRIRFWKILKIKSDAAAFAAPRSVLLFSPFSFHWKKSRSEDLEKREEDREKREKNTKKKKPLTRLFLFGAAVYNGLNKLQPDRHIPKNSKRLL